jgi:hypothetical protein
VTDIDRALIAFYGRPFRFPSGDYHRMGSALAADRKRRTRVELTAQATDPVFIAEKLHDAGVQIERLRAALRGVVNILGPDFCPCEGNDPDCGLGGEALQVAREALAGGQS